jgi:hypothetical protein
MAVPPDPAPAVAVLPSDLKCRLPPPEMPIKIPQLTHGTIFEACLMMKTKKDILKDILLSAQTHCVLKIKLKNTPTPVITAVEEVNKNQIVLKPTCLYGYQLKKRDITLPEIEAVTRYKTNFHHPLFEKLRFIKNNISEIRNNFGRIKQEPSGTLNVSKS